MNNAQAPAPELFHKPFFIPPSADLFAQRAERLNHLAQESAEPWSAYLRLLAALCAKQQSLYEQLRLSAALPPADGARLPEAWRDLFDALPPLPTESSAPEALQELAQRSLRGDLEHSARHPELIRIHAALEVIWTRAALELTEAQMPPHADRRFCPHCGQAAGVGIIYTNELNNLRYLHCPLCNSRWNVLRAQCSFCQDASAIELHKIDNPANSAQKAARAESCGCCQRYRKNFMQAEQIDVDPIADDLASLALDILMGEGSDGRAFERGGRNPYLLSD